MLAEETDYTAETTNIKCNSKRTTPSRLAGVVQELPGSLSKITLPDDILQTTQFSNSDTSTYLDVRFVQYPPIDGPFGVLSAVVDYSMWEVGYYSDTDIYFY